MRRRAGQVLTAFIACVTATAIGAACSQTVAGTAHREDVTAPAGAPDSDRSYGYVDNRCGLLDDSTVAATLDAIDVTRPYSGAVCQYILNRPGVGATVTLDVTFSWFAQGSLARERRLAAERGAVVEDIEVERHEAFSARRDVTGAACAVTAAAGTGVLSWRVQYRGQKTGEPCADAGKLLSATLRSDM